MKKISFVFRMFIIVTLFLSATNVSLALVQEKTATCIDLTHDLAIGSTDADTEGQVTDLQNFLRSVGIPHVSKVKTALTKATGYYGAVTDSYLKDFQSAFHLSDADVPEALRQISCDPSGIGFSIMDPNGGESVEAGKTYTIQWMLYGEKIPGIVKADISLVDDNGTAIKITDKPVSKETIHTVLISKSSNMPGYNPVSKGAFSGYNSTTVHPSHAGYVMDYNWKVNKDLSGDYKIHIHLTNTGNRDLDATAESLNSFTIVSGSGSTHPTPSPKPSPVAGSSSIKLIKPNGGEKLKAGTTYKITWAASNIPLNKKAKIELESYTSGDDYVPVTEIGSVDANALSFEWKIPKDLSSKPEYKISISVDGAGVTGFGDVSDNSFSVTSSVGTTEEAIDTYPAAGFLDTATTCEAVVGWSCDLDKVSQPIDVSLYDGTKKIGTITANLERPDLATNPTGPVCNSTTAHGFTFPIPNSLRDFKAHTLHAFGLDIDSNGKPSGEKKELTLSPLPMTCSKASASTGVLNWVTPGDNTTVWSAGDKVEIKWSSSASIKNKSVVVRLFDASQALKASFILPSTGDTTTKSILVPLSLVPGPYTIELSNSSPDTAPQTIHVTIAPATPVITFISPASASKKTVSTISGELFVTVHGKNFTADSKVYFGGVKMDSTFYPSNKTLGFNVPKVTSVASTEVFVRTEPVNSLTSKDSNKKVFKITGKLSFLEIYDTFMANVLSGIDSILGVEDAVPNAEQNY